jgi:hypothetical protein
MQEKVKIEILKEGYQVQRQSVESGLESKARFVKSQYEKELTDPIFKRVKAEEEHIRECVGLLQTIDDVIEAYEAELQSERGKLARCRAIQEMFANDASEYREKYYMIILQLNETIATRNTKQHGTNEAGARA